MSAFNKIKEFEDAAKKAEEEFTAQYPAAEEAKPVEAEPAPEPVTTPEPTPEPVAPAPVDDQEKKYKDAIKGMNDAQRKAADLAKAKEEADKRSEELEAKLNDALDRAKRVQESAKAQPADPDDDLEADMPEVSRIAQKYATKAQRELETRLEETNKRLKAWEEKNQRVETETTAKRMMDEIKAVHADYDEVVNSEEMVHWINNDAPPIFKMIFEGAVPFQAKDAITVLNAFKSTTTPKTQQASTATPSAAEVAAPVKTNTPISTRLKTEAPPTLKEMDWYMHNSHKLSPEENAEWDRRLNGTT